MQEMEHRVRYLPAWAAAVALAVGLASLGGGFVWDDHWTLEQSPLLSHPSFLPRMLVEAHGFGPMGVGEGGGYYRPLATLLQGLCLLLFGARALPLHLLSVVSHAGVAFLLGLVLRRMTPSAAWGALLFAAFPQCADSFAWISALPDLLAALGIVTAILLFQRSAFWGGGVALLAALLGKESAIGGVLWLPLLARFGWLGDRRRWIAPAGALGAYLAIRAITVGFARGPIEAAPGVVAQGASLVGRIFLIDLLRLVWPWTVTLEPPSWVVDGGHGMLGLAGVAILVLALAGGFVLLRRGPSALVVLLPVLALLPVIQIVRTNDVFGARFLYLPAMGGAIGVGLLIARRQARRPRFAPIALALLALSFALRTGLRAREWRDDLTLFEAEVRRNPGSVRARVQLADVLLNRGELARAKPMVERLALELPTHPRVRSQQALFWMNEGRAAEAERVFRELVTTWHRTPTLLANLAGCQLRLGKNEEGLATLDEAIRSSTPTPGMRNNRALALQALGRLDEARREFEAALARDPRYRPARVNLIFLLAGAMQKPEEARIEANRYLELFPNGPEAARVRELLRGGS